MKDRFFDTFSILIVFAIGIAVGRYIVPSTSSHTYEALTTEEIQDGLDVYAACMDSTRRPGCRISLENFGVYHDLKREQRRRETLTLEPEQ